MQPSDFVDICRGQTLLNPCNRAIVGDVLELVRRRVFAPRIITMDSSGISDVPLGDVHFGDGHLSAKQIKSDLHYLTPGPGDESLPLVNQYSGGYPRAYWLNANFPGQYTIRACDKLWHKLVCRLDQDVYVGISTMDSAVYCWRNREEKMTDAGVGPRAYYDICAHTKDSVILQEFRGDGHLDTCIKIFDIRESKVTARSVREKRNITALASCLGKSRTVALCGDLRIVDERVNGVIIPIALDKYTRASLATNDHVQMAVVDDNMVVAARLSDLILIDIRAGQPLPYLRLPRFSSSWSISVID